MTSECAGAVAIYYGVRSSVKTLNEINRISARRARRYNQQDYNASVLEVLRFIAQVSLKAIRGEVAIYYGVPRA